MHLHLQTILLRLRNGKLIFCLVLLGLGIWFRFGNLHQVYWHDEAYTSLRISGYTSVEVKQNLFNNQIVNLDKLLYYQGINQERTATDTINSLALDDAQHPPLYYLLARYWVATFGESIWILRSFSALFSLLSLPAIYWLCQELFALTIPKYFQISSQFPSQFLQSRISQGRLTGAIAIILVALSPFHILYAQEAREYALWAGLTLGMSAAFLRSLRLHNWQNWGLYTIFLTASLYTSPLSGFVALGHGVYALLILVILERSIQIKKLFAYSIASIFSLIAFVPWLLVLIRDGAVAGASWTSKPIPLPIWLKLWGLNIVRCFILTEGDFGFDTWQVYATLPFLLLLISYSLCFLCRYAPPKIWLFVLIFLGATSLPLVLPDLILGGQRSTAGRYLVPTILGMQIAIAFLFANVLTNPATRIFTRQTSQLKISQIFAIKPWLSRLTQGAIAIVLLLNLGAGFDILKAETSWIKVINYNLPSLTAIVNQSQKSLVISAAEGINFGTIFALAHTLNPQVKLILLDSSHLLDMAQITNQTTGFRNVFLLNPSEELRRSFSQQNIQIKLVYQDFHLYLWRSYSNRQGG